jgi:Na+/H+ antiporter NhaA
VPLSILANAGIDLRGGVLSDALRSPIAWGLMLGLVVGRVVGIGATVPAGARLGLGRLPQGVRSGQVLGGAALSGIGFTVSLLITGLAFDGRALQNQGRVGVLLAALLAA